MDQIAAFFASLSVFAIVLLIAASIFWLWILIDALTNPRLQPIEKLVWVLVIFFLHFVGALIYFVIGRQQRVGGL